MKTGNKGYTLLDNENVLENEDFNIQEQSVYIAILSYHNKEKGYSYPSYGQLKVRSKVSDTRTLQKHVNSLIKKGYIRKETINGIGCRYYILKSMKIPSGELHHVEDYTTCKTTPPPSGELHHDLVENYTTTNTNTNTNTNNNNKNDKYMDLTFIDDVIDKVKLTQEQYEKLVSKFGKTLVNNQILSLDSYIVNGKGAKYKDHYRAVNTWCNKNYTKEVRRKNIVTDKDVEELYR